MMVGGIRMEGKMLFVGDDIIGSHYTIIEY